MFSLPKVGGSFRLQKIINEVDNLRLLDHENIVKVIDTHHGSQSFWLVMEFSGKATLQDVLKVTQDGRLSERRRQ